MSVITQKILATREEILTSDSHKKTQQHHNGKIVIKNDGKIIQYN